VVSASKSGAVLPSLNLGRSGSCLSCVLGVVLELRGLRNEMMLPMARSVRTSSGG
jgi:hypothetical protein